MIISCSDVYEKLTLTKVSLRVFPNGWTCNAQHSTTSKQRTRWYTSSIATSFCVFHLIKAFFHSSSIIISIVGKCDDEWTLTLMCAVGARWNLNISKVNIRTLCCENAEVWIMKTHRMSRKKIYWNSIKEDDHKFPKEQNHAHQHNLQRFNCALLYRPKQPLQLMYRRIMTDHLMIQGGSFET